MRRFAWMLCLCLVLPPGAFAETFFDVVLLGTGSPRPALNRNGRGDVAAVLASSASYRAILDHHTDPAEAGTLFAKARPKLAVFSHIVAPSSPPADAAEILRQTRTTYAGPVVVGDDMMRFRVTDAGVEQVMGKP